MIPRPRHDDHNFNVFWQKVGNKKLCTFLLIIDPRLFPQGDWRPRRILHLHKYLVRVSSQAPKKMKKEHKKSARKMKKEHKEVLKKRKEKETGALVAYYIFTNILSE